MKTKRRNWKKRYYALQRRYKKLKEQNNELGLVQNQWMHLTSAMR